jgi:hypothetical protein
MATLSNISATEKTPKPPKTPKYFCEQCRFGCTKNVDYKRHVNTQKHKKGNILEQMATKITPKTPHDKIAIDDVFIDLTCKICAKSFETRSGLWRHNKKHPLPIQEENIDNKKEYELDANFDLKSIFFDMVKQNEEFKQIMIEQNKCILEQNNKLMDLANNQSITNNNNINYNNTTNKFNLTFFLNETCKDAMNIQEFIDYVTVQHSDFENFGKMGYVEALTRIFLRNLMELDVCRRPIHCSDSKREVLYVKDNDVWVSDVTREKLIRTIKYIANKNVKQIPGWMDKNPDSKNTQTKLHDKYMRMLCFSMGAKTEEEDQEYYKKIIRNVAKEVCIDKIR